MLQTREAPEGIAAFAVQGGNLESREGDDASVRRGIGNIRQEISCPVSQKYLVR